MQDENSRWRGSWLWPLAAGLRVLGSVQLAVAIIAVCIAVLVWGTRIEGTYGAAAARFGIYGTWWFTALNVLLAVNVLCALVIRLPWRQRQAGFVLTHVGILVLLAGCLATRQWGVEAQLSVYEGHAAQLAYEDSYHFELRSAGETIRVPFVSGPFSWNDYDNMSLFPWCLAYRSQGIVFDRGGIALEVLDYLSEPQPIARVRLTVDGKSEEFRLGASSEGPPRGGQQHVVEGRDRRVTITLPPDAVDLSFQVYLRRSQRKLDPGTGMASHYSSRVDFLAISNPPKKLPEEKMLRENVLIKLNAPVDFADPLTGRTYRLFQSGFDGPWLPGDPEFDRLVAGDHSRDQVYLSQLSVNYDPGRGLKYAGCLMIVVGIGIVYYSRRLGSKSSGVRGQGSGVGDQGSGVCKRPPTAVGGGEAAGRGLCSLLILLSVVGVCRAEERAELDWSTWQRLPAFSQGRIMPLDSFARETVEAICGREEPTLSLGNDRGREFSAAELLFSWLVEPEKWENVPFLVAEDKQLRRDVLGLPLVDANGRRLRYASPVEVENSVELGRRQAELKQREEAEGKPFRPTGVEKSVKNLVDAYGRYRQLTFDPNAPKDVPRRFYARVRSAADAWRKLAGDLQIAKRIRREQEIRQEMVASGDALQKIIAAMHGGELSLGKVEPAVAAFGRAGGQLAARLGNSDDKPLAALAADLGRQTAEMHLALYDSGDCVRLVPALDAGALEENRTPGDDASPWLSFQAMILGSDDLLRGYPPELRAVRKAFAAVKAAYQYHGGADILVGPGQSGQTRMSAPPRATSAPPERFAAAMERFAQSLRALAEKIDPLRAKLPIQHRDQDLIAATAYPPPGSTDAEVFYNRLDPFFWSWAVSLAATVCLLLAVGRWQKPMFWLGVAVLLAAQGFTAAGMGLRYYITDLVPLTGMFETVVFVALYAALVGLWFTLKPLLRPCVPLLGTSSAALPTDHEHCLFQAVAHDVFQRRLFVVAGAMVSFIAAALAYYAPSSVMHRHIGAAMPILRDNFWLAVHVVTIMASYATGAIALVLGNFALGYYFFGRYGSRQTPRSSPHTPCADQSWGGSCTAAPESTEGPGVQLLAQRLEDGTRRVPTTMGTESGTRRMPPAMCSILAGFIYTAIQITVLLLAAGTVLGALWADKAWGRFWGWDPKEVWALVSLLVYLLILHTRHIGWSGNLGMAAAAVLGFTAILFTWYGVNFLLGSGMHAYGSGAGGKWAVVAAILIEWLFLAAAAVRKAIESEGAMSSE